jgi:hypothetical protein
VGRREGQTLGWVCVVLFCCDIGYVGGNQPIGLGVGDGGVCGQGYIHRFHFRDPPVLK